MVVARPVEPSSADFQNLGSSAPIVPTKILTDPEELDRQLLQNGYTEICNLDGNVFDSETITQIELNGVDINVNAINVINTQSDLTLNGSVSSPESPKNIVVSPVDVEVTLPETDRFTVTLTKNEYGLGITVAGYVCEREDLCGIFIKSISEGSDAHKCGEIRINDRIVEVDGQSLQDVTNHQAVEKLKQAGNSVTLTLERYLRGPKYEHLQEALACQESKDLSPPSPSITTLSWIPIDTEVRNI